MKGQNKPVSKYKYARQEGWASLVINSVLFILKYWAGLISGSIALIADAWHTLSDSLTSVIVLLGAKISEKPPDEEHPFGHGRAESIATIIIGIILVVVGIGFISEGIGRIRLHQEAFFGRVAIIVTIISIVVKEALAQYAVRLGKKHQIYSIIADGYHHRSDAVSSLIILIGIFTGRYIWWIDGLLGILVGLMIIWSGFLILKETINPILGENPGNEIIDRLNQMAAGIYQKDLHIHHIHIHRYGDHAEITFHIRLPGKMQIDDANLITASFVRLIKDELNMSATIYLDAVKD
jgi:cation diffusion facilitator family transporter